MRCKFDPIELAIDSDIRSFFELLRVVFIGARNFSLLDIISEAFDNFRVLVECVSRGPSSFCISMILRRNISAVFWAR